MERSKNGVASAGGWVRRFGWAAAIVLVVYGGLLTTVGLLVYVGAIDAAADADTTALTWHAFFWDPWFLVWGIALTSFLRQTAHDRPSAHCSQRAP